MNLGIVLSYIAMALFPVNTPVVHEVQASEAQVIEAQVVVEETWKDKLESSPLLKKLAECESNTNPDALNAVDVNGKRSVGLLQYQDNTFVWWAKQIDPQKKWDIWNPEHQVEVGLWALEKGYAYHWGCYAQVKEKI